MEIKLFKAQVKRMRYESLGKAFEDFSKMPLFNKVKEEVDE